ncbi:MazG nucleotide pyrophosphohydrolase domain-containing protein [Nesterenkonia sp. CL21]|uniref:MazG nucleotide pyrophosphohydrolase domain-containing protein n=1 Tax=Nesterenkonia sp. CL21 TaxID=3064894 RepID=UPI00287B5251|nr:MazG nucleotide pyrophosphohydrolase domain-containing protein [Nesterenkonia sp. CL21]MDS2172976.1 MazG nucleotide pyrophosphohydrolase domain-containing protein [Nesterenkonia sp. CL21]
MPQEIRPLESLADQLEQVSAGYAAKFGLHRDGDWFMLKLQEELGELTSSYVALTGRARPRGRDDAADRQAFEEELADVLAHVLLLARHAGIDADRAVDDKWLRWLDDSADV